MTKFKFNSMQDKIYLLTGKRWGGGFNAIRAVKENCHKVTLDESIGLNLVDVRDWCQHNFSDNWIYQWNDFYFKYHKDATLFSLRWA